LCHNIIHWKRRLEKELPKGLKYSMKIKLFKSKLVSKLKLYWSVIRLIVVHGCETCVLKESIMQRLSVCERRILRKIFGPTKKDNVIWRIKNEQGVG
jgi:hypothetical protein